MQKLNLIAHCGANFVERAALSRPQLPAATSTYVPISHDYFVDLVEDRLNEAGMRVVDSAFALASDGANMFGVLQVGAAARADYTTIVGLRNSHIKWFPAALACGSGVFVCDNMAFTGEITFGRKHTRLILEDLPRLVTDAIGRIVKARDVQDRRYEAYKERTLASYEAEYLMVEMLRREIINPMRLPQVVRQWDAPDHEEFARTGDSGWRMFNAVTEALKGSNIIEMQRKTSKLHDLMDEVAEFEYAEAA